MDPLSIPLGVREAAYKKGNIAPNPSFELSENAGIKGWKIIGSRVKVTDIKKSDYDSTEASHGNHAVKIVRTNEDVKNIGNPTEGIESNFIEVIPANYDFHFDIRLDDIIPAPWRHERFRQEMGIEKGIDIHLQYYDKNKNPLKSDRYFQFAHREIDNSFKGFAFSNYYYINDFNWGKVRGETWDYPFSVGDLPDNCRYVKIFFGLKIPGTMWVDNVDYRLSKWNFTTLERMDSLFKKKYDLTDLLIPTPQVLENSEHLQFKERDITLYHKTANSAETKRALELLQKCFKNALGRSPKIKASSSLSNTADGMNIILVKNGDPFSTQLKEGFRAIKDKNQGYFIRRKTENIYIGANTGRGFFYGAASLSQLIDDENAELHYANITDWPDFKSRSTKFIKYDDDWSQQKHQEELQQQLNDIDFYAFYKINTFYNGKGTYDDRWWQTGEFYTYFYKKVNKQIKQYGDILHTALQLNTTGQLTGIKLNALIDSVRNLYSYGTKDGFEKLKKALKPGLNNGARTVMFLSDDNVPYPGEVRGMHAMFSDADQEKFINLAEAHAYVLNKLKSWLDKSYGEVRLEFVPPAYNTWFVDNSRGSAEAYFRDLDRKLDSSITLVWTGPVIRSLSYDMADLHRADKIYKRKLMIWDNSPYARTSITPDGGYPENYPKKSVMANLFQPFDIQYPKNFSNYVDSHYYSNLGGFGEINKIKYMTFADFSWNTKDYNPDFSLFKALVQYVGRSNIKPLLTFNDAYFKFVSTWAQLSESTWAAQSKRQPTTIYKCAQQKKNTAQKQIEAMKEAYNRLRQVDNEALKNELKNKMDSKIEEWDKLCE